MYGSTRWKRNSTTGWSRLLKSTATLFAVSNETGLEASFQCGTWKLALHFYQPIAETRATHRGQLNRATAAPVESWMDFGFGF